MEKDQTILTDSVADNRRLLHERMQHTEDLKMVDVPAGEERTVTVCYLEGLTDDAKLVAFN